MKTTIDKTRKFSTVDSRAFDRLRNLGGNRLIGRMIDFFSTYSEPMLLRGVEAFQAGNLEELGRAAHSLKSTAYYLGAYEVQNLAEEIEQLASQGNQTRVQELVTALQAAFSRTKGCLEEVKKGLGQ